MCRCTCNVGINNNKSNVFLLSRFVCLFYHSIYVFFKCSEIKSMKIFNVKLSSICDFSKIRRTRQVVTRGIGGVDQTGERARVDQHDERRSAAGDR